MRSAFDLGEVIAPVHSPNDRSGSGREYLHQNLVGEGLGLSIDSFGGRHYHMPDVIDFHGEPLWQQGVGGHLDPKLRTALATARRRFAPTPRTSVTTFDPKTRCGPAAQRRPTRFSMTNQRSSMAYLSDRFQRSGKLVLEVTGASWQVPAAVEQVLTAAGLPPQVADSPYWPFGGRKARWARRGEARLAPGG